MKFLFFWTCMQVIRPSSPGGAGVAATLSTFASSNFKCGREFTFVVAIVSGQSH